MQTSPSTDYRADIVCPPPRASGQQWVTGTLIWVAGEAEPKIIDPWKRVLTVSNCIELLNSHNPKKLRVGLCFVTELGDDRAVLPLLKVLDSRDQQNRQDALYAIKEIAGGMKRRRFFGNPYVIGRDEWRPQPNSPEGEKAFQIAVERLTKILQTDHPLVQSSAASALAFLGDSRAIDALSKAVRSGHDDVRENAAFALGRIGMNGNPQVVDSLLEALQDKLTRVRHKAIFWLGSLKDKRAVAPIINILAGKGKGLDERREAASALGELGDSQALSVLLSILRHSTSALAGDAGSAIGKIKDKSAVPDLIDMLKDEQCPNRGSVAGVLGGLGDERALEPLIEVVKYELGKPIRWYALQGLAGLKDRRAYDIALACLHDEDEVVRSSAVEVLGEIGDTRAIEPLIEALSDADPDVRGNIAYALAKLADPRVLEPLIQLLSHDPDAQVRVYTAEALGWLGDAAAIPALEYALEHDDGESDNSPFSVRYEARESLKKIRGKLGIGAS